MKTKIKPVTKTKLVLKKKQAVKPSVKMISYSIEMTIPTGAYANIKPQIIVSAPTPEQAHDYIAPHMNKMWKEYFMVNERRQEIAPTVLEKAQANLAAIVTPPMVEPAKSQEPIENPPSSNVAVIKATKAIESCASLEALELIKNQVELSVKLAKEEKPALRNAIVMRFNELNADAFAKKNGL